MFKKNSDMYFFFQNKNFFSSELKHKTIIAYFERFWEMYGVTIGNKIQNLFILSHVRDCLLMTSLKFKDSFNEYLNDFSNDNGFIFDKWTKAGSKKFCKRVTGKDDFNYLFGNQSKSKKKNLPRIKSSDYQINLKKRIYKEGNLSMSSLQPSDYIETSDFSHDKNNEKLSVEQEKFEHIENFKAFKENFLEHTSVKFELAYRLENLKVMFNNINEPVKESFGESVFEHISSKKSLDINKLFIYIQ